MDDGHPVQGSRHCRLGAGHHRHPSLRGPPPNGGLMVAAELPRLRPRQEYIVFLRNTEWNVSAVVGDLAFRVDTVDDTEVLVDSDGAPVLQIGAFGFDLGAPVFEGPTRDGSAPKPVEGGLKALGGRRPLDLPNFAKSLQANLDAQVAHRGQLLREARRRFQLAWSAGCRDARRDPGQERRPDDQRGRI
mgnify:CR=1 FL=1